MKDLIKEFQLATGITVIASSFGKDLTTVAVGGKFSKFVVVDSVDQLKLALNYINTLGTDKNYLVLGNGSNLLVNDSGVEDWIIQLGKGFRFVEEVSKSNSATNLRTFLIGSNSYLPSVSQKLCEAGFSGLEFAGGIPASIGGASFMNAGAHGGEMSEILKKVFCILPSGEEIIFNKEDLKFEYRKSGISKGCIIYQIEIDLVESNREVTTNLRTKNLQHRKATQPLTLPSFGSVFKNPSNIELTAGQLIEKAELKGVKSGTAEVSTMHGNWIVNPYKNASCEDVKNLIDLCKIEVKKIYGVELREEVVYW